MKKHVKKEKNSQIKKNIQIKRYINKKPLENQNLLKEIQKSKIEIKKNSVPLNYIKINEKITTKVYKIPINIGIFREPSNMNIYLTKDIKDMKDTIFHKKKIFRTINTDNLKKNGTNNGFPIKPFSSIEMGYKYYKQELNNSYPHKMNSKKRLFLRKDKSTFILTPSKSSENYYNHINNKNNENIFKNNRAKSPTNINKYRGLNSPFYQRFLNNSCILRNHQKTSNNKINGTRIININCSNDNINSIFNKDNYNYPIYSNNKDNIDNEIHNNNNRTLNNNSLHNIRTIYLNNNCKCNDKYNNNYSLQNPHIFRSPVIKKVKSPSFIEERNIDNTINIINYSQFNGGKVKVISEKKHYSNDDEYIIETILSKKIYDKKRGNNNNKNSYISDNNERHLNTLGRDLGDNYRYYERNEVKSKLSKEKTKHIRRSPVHIYEFDNYKLKDDKKLFSKSPQKGKLIRIYRNKDNKKCKMCYRNETKGDFNYYFSGNS